MQYNKKLQYKKAASWEGEELLISTAGLQLRNCETIRKRKLEIKLGNIMIFRRGKSPGKTFKHTKCMQKHRVSLWNNYQKKRNRSLLLECLESRVKYYSGMQDRHRKSAGPPHVGSVSR